MSTHSVSREYTRANVKFKKKESSENYETRKRESKIEMAERTGLEPASAFAR
jgi:hypothetical protein